MFDKVKNILKKMDELTYSKKQLNNTNKLHIAKVSNIDESKLSNINNTHKMFEEIRQLQNQYKKYLEYYKEITEELWNKKLYSKAISQDNIFNKYSDRFMYLTSMYIHLLPHLKEYETKCAEIHTKYNDNYIVSNKCNQDIVNLIRLLEKMNRDYILLKVCGTLLELGYSEDGTRHGIKGRIFKAINNLKTQNINIKFENNEIIDVDKNIILKLEENEIV